MQAINVLVNDNDANIEEIREIVDFVDEQTSSSSDESSNDERINHPKCGDFIKIIDEMDNNVFKSHMRVKRTTADYLIGKNLHKS